MEKDESELEENIQEDISKENSEDQEQDNQNSESFIKFMEPNFSVKEITTSLSPIEITKKENLEQEVFNISTQNQDQQKEINYTPRTQNYNITQQEQERIYQISQSGETPIVLRSTQNHEEVRFIDPMRQMGITRQESIEPQQIKPEFRDSSARLPFEEDKKKYKEVKF